MILNSRNGQGNRLLGTLYRLGDCARNCISGHQAQKMAGFLNCAGVLSVDPQNTRLGWVGKETTFAEKTVVDFVRAAPITAPQKILHVGIGNGNTGRSLRRDGVEIIGISIDGEEITNSRQIYNSTHLVNKYAVSELRSRLGNSKFRWIVDVNLFSYACCWGHAIRYLWFLCEHLMEGGSIVTHASGGRYAPRGIMLTPLLLERVTQIVEMQVTTHPEGVILITRKQGECYS